MGPKLFTVYSALIATICHQHGLQVLMYADDSQLYLFFDWATPGMQDDIKKKIEKCILCIRTWMKANNLKLNDEKTELLIFVPSQHSEKIVDRSLQVGDSTVVATELARDLGVLLDPQLTLEKHVQAICKSAYYHLRMIGSIRKCLDVKTTEKLVHTFITSRLDCGNAVLAGLPK